MQRSGYPDLRIVDLCAQSSAAPKSEANLANGRGDYLGRKRARKIPELGLGQICVAGKFSILQMIVIAGTYSCNFKLDSDQRALLISFLVVLGETIVAAVGIGNVDPVEGPAVAVITSLGGNGAWTLPG